MTRQIRPNKGLMAKFFQAKELEAILFGNQLLKSEAPGLAGAFFLLPVLF